MQLDVSWGLEIAPKSYSMPINVRQLQSCMLGHTEKGPLYL